MAGSMRPENSVSKFLLSSSGVEKISRLPKHAVGLGPSCSVPINGGQRSVGS